MEITAYDIRFEKSRIEMWSRYVARVTLFKKFDVRVPYMLVHRASVFSDTLR